MVRPLVQPRRSLAMYEHTQQEVVRHTSNYPITDFINRSHGNPDELATG